VQGNAFQSCLHVHWLRPKHLSLQCNLVYSVRPCTTKTAVTRITPLCLTCIYLHLDRLSIRVLEAETLNVHTQINPAVPANFLCFTYKCLSNIRQFFSTFNQPTQNLLASGSKHQLFHRSFMLRSYIYHLCSVEPPSHTNWAANVSITLPLILHHCVGNNGEIVTAVCPLFHGLEIIKGTDGLRMLNRRAQIMCRRESGSRKVTSTETGWMETT
jgi:hypothetical protein